MIYATRRSARSTKARGSRSTTSSNTMKSWTRMGPRRWTGTGRGSSRSGSSASAELCSRRRRRGASGQSGGCVELLNGRDELRQFGVRAQRLAGGRRLERSVEHERHALVGGERNERTDLEELLRLERDLLAAQLSAGGRVDHLVTHD